MFFGPLFLVAVGVAVYFLWRHDQQPIGTNVGARDEAVEILKRRYAAGEIGRDEYEQKLRDLME